MAGGVGTRMRPFTEILPKPLVPLKRKTNDFKYYG